MLEWMLAAAGVLFAAFHSGSETGTYCMNRLRLRLRAEQGHAAARALLRFAAQPRLAISTMLIGTNVGLYVATIVCTRKLDELLSGVHAELYSGLILPPILLVCAEIIPKSLFQHHAEWLMYRVVWPLRLSQAALYLPAVLLRWLSMLPQRLLGRRAAPAWRPLSRGAFRHYLSEGVAHGVLSPFQRAMADNVLRLKALQVAQVMTPLDRTVMLPADAGADAMLELLRARRYSRIPVHGATRAEIVGVVHAMDVACVEGELPPVRELAREPLTVRRDASVADVLWTLRRARQQIAIVTDPDGRAVGVATVKDLVEEVVGELDEW